MGALSGAAPGSVIGPGTGFYATGHNPSAVVENLQYTRVFMSAGNGVPTPADGTGGGVANAEEAARSADVRCPSRRAEGRRDLHHLPDARGVPLVA